MLNYYIKLLININDVALLFNRFLYFKIVHLRILNKKVTIKKKYYYLALL
jgi:hypothetical protein